MKFHTGSFSVVVDGPVIGTRAVTVRVTALAAGPVGFATVPVAVRVQTSLASSVPFHVTVPPSYACGPRAGSSVGFNRSCEFRGLKRIESWLLIPASARLYATC